MPSTDSTEGVAPPNPLPTFYVTFGIKYRHEAHPYWAGAHPDGWLEIQARDEAEARIMVQRFVGNVYAFLYEEARFERKWHPRGRLALLLQDGGTITSEGVEPPTPRFTTSDPEWYGVASTDVVAARIEGELAEHSDRDAIENLGYEAELVHKGCLTQGLALFREVTDVDSRVQAFELDWSQPHHCTVCEESIT